jgi:hypothetical protein
MNSSSFLTDSTHLGTPCSGLALSLERQFRYLYLLCRHGRTPARRRSKMARKLIVVRTTLLKFLFWLRRSSLSLRRVNFVMFRKLDERFAENIAGALTNDTTVGRSPKTQLLRIPLTSDIIPCILQAAILGCVKDDPFGPQERVLGFSPLQHGE